MDYVAFGNNELKDLPPVQEGDNITCPHCGGAHVLKAGKNQDGEGSTTVLVYKCGETKYLAAVDGKSVISLFTRSE